MTCVCYYTPRVSFIGSSRIGVHIFIRANTHHNRIYLAGSFVSIPNTLCGHVHWLNRCNGSNRKAQRITPIIKINNILKLTPLLHDFSDESFNIAKNMALPHSLCLAAHRLKLFGRAVRGSSWNLSWSNLQVFAHQDKMLIRERYLVNDRLCDSDIL